MNTTRPNVKMNVDMNIDDGEYSASTHYNRKPYVWLEYSLAKIQNNFKVFSGYVFPAECAAVLKSDAYGVGVADVGCALFEVGCRMFFVAYLDEADALAKALFRKANAFPSYELGDNRYSLFIFDGPFIGEWAREVEMSRYIPVLNTAQNIEDWNKYARTIEKMLPAVLYIDTGLNRLGIPYEEFSRFRAENFEYIDWRCFMSHFVASADAGHAANSVQIDKAAKIREKYPNIPFSFADTAGVLLGSHTHCSIIRLGMGLFGLYNYLPGIECALTVYGKILQIKDVKAGSGIGYNWTFIAKEPTRVAIVAGGYADGVVHAANIALKNFYINGKSAPVVGRGSMDLTIVDISCIGGVNVGDNAVILGDKRQLQHITAGDASTYRLLTGLGNRVRRFSV
jgi:alanine racemase